MEIHWKNYLIQVDDNQFTLLRKIMSKKKDTGEEYENEEVLGYFSHLENCLQKMLRCETANKNEVLTLKEYISLWKETALQVKSDIRNELSVTQY